MNIPELVNMYVCIQVLIVYSDCSNYSLIFIWFIIMPKCISMNINADIEKGSHLVPKYIKLH